MFLTISNGKVLVVVLFYDHVIIYIVSIYAVSTNTFSVGIKWNYDNEHDDNYVRPFHGCLKPEILEYEHIENNEELYSEVRKKAEAYRGTELVKSIFGDNNSTLGYLMCIILYTDYTALSTSFSSTFRAINKYEPIHSIKRRHRKFYRMSVGLKMLMRIWGQDYSEKHGHTGPLPRLLGPFYCGMNWVMNMNRFNIILHGPTSTSIQKAVAARFGGDKGFLIEFDNSKGQGRDVKGFDVSWLSRYGSQEDERYENILIS